MAQSDEVQDAERHRHPLPRRGAGVLREELHRVDGPGHKADGLLDHRGGNAEGDPEKLYRRDGPGALPLHHAADGRDQRKGGLAGIGQEAPHRLGRQFA